MCPAVGQASQLLSVVCAVAALNLPLTQSVHAAADSADALNLPAAQASTLEPEPVKPASALQATDAAALPEFAGHGVQVSDVCCVLALNLPASQSVHAAAIDATALNLPAPQAAMVEPEPVKPASAMQSPSATDAAALPELSGHDVQVSDVCAVSALYLPLTQSVHAAAEDVTALNLPAAQAATLEPEPVKPASALQSPSATDAALLPELSGHGVQDVALSVSALYVPVMQFTQFAPLAFSPGPHSFTQSDSAFEAVPVVVLPVGQLHDGRFGSGGRSSSGRRRRR